MRADAPELERFPGKTEAKDRKTGDCDMKKILLGAAGLIAMGAMAPASAADLAARPYTKAPPMMAAMYDWSGFYIGINGGGGSAHTCWDLTAVAAGAVVPAAPEGCSNATGGTVGGQIGYRWQASNWVFGVEGQANWADFSGSNVNLFFPAITDRTKVDAFGLITGQVGYAWNNVLGYVKGGAAVTSNKYTTFTTATGGTIDSASETRWGGTIGAGLEVGFAGNWSVGVEYDHLFMGNHSVNANTPAGVFSATDRIRQDVDMGLVRLNYRFGGPVIAKY
jgi:outer membrane immunogenic protein